MDNERNPIVIYHCAKQSHKKQLQYSFEAQSSLDTEKITNQQLQIQNSMIPVV